jgi:hypothetical protein
LESSKKSERIWLTALISLFTIREKLSRQQARTDSGSKQVLSMSVVAAHALAPFPSNLVYFPGNAAGSRPQAGEFCFYEQ